MSATSFHELFYVRLIVMECLGTFFLVEKSHWLWGHHPYPKAFTHFANVSVFLRVWVCTFSHEVPHFQSHKTGLTLFFFHCDFNPQSPTNNPNSGASSYSNHNQQVFSYPNLPPGCLSAVSPSLPMSLFTSPGNTPRGSIPPRWPTAIQVAPVSSSGNVASEEESTDYQMVSGFGGMNPDENMLEGSC